MLCHIDALDHPALAPYTNIKERELARSGDLFIVESENVVRRLLHSSYAVHSVIVSDKRLTRIQTDLSDDFPTYVLPDALVHELLGYKFHSGVMACGRRKAEVSLDQVLPPPAASPRVMTLLVCPSTNNAENIGALMRIAAGFGVDAVLLGERCHDPFWRMAIRVSMGTVFSLPIVRSQCLADDLRRLRTEWDVHLCATLLDASSTPLSLALPHQRVALLMGSEAHGLEPQYIDLCDQKLTIPMSLGTDSLNVAVSAAVFLYHYTQVLRR